VLALRVLALTAPVFKHSEAFPFRCDGQSEETDRYWNAIVNNAARKVSADGARTAGLVLADHPRRSRTRLRRWREAKRAFER